MSTEKVYITSPVGRIVAGSLYKANDKDFDGKPLVVKTGQNAGQPRVSYYIGLAIRKGQETHWANASYVNHKGELIEWGKIIWSVGHRNFPEAAKRPDFAWKIEDGDSTIPNKRNKRPCDGEGWPGHWIIRLSSGFAPKVYRPEGAGFVQEMTEGFIKAGHFVQVLFSVDGNGNQNNPGIYLNTQMVAFSAYGPEISFGPSVEDAGFGQSALPAGASAIPLASAAPMPAASAIGVPPAALPSATAPVAVLPNLAFLQVPPAASSPVTSGAAIPPSPPAAPMPASPSKKMTALANGISYEAYLAAGWTDANLIANGYLAV